MPFHEHISALFSPQSVAIVGASRHTGKLGNTVLANLMRAGYPGKIFPVNVQGGTILGLEALRKLEDIPEDSRPLDLAVLCLPAGQTPRIMRQLAALPARAVAVLSAGFRETGSRGAHLEEEIKNLALEHNMALLGPNSFGFADSGAKLNLTCARGDCPSGNIGFFSQCGALCMAISDWAGEQQFGFSSFVSLGNKALLDECDMIARLAEDANTKVIVGCLESVENGPKFLRSAHNATRRKPVILLKAGRTREGARAVSSHSGSLAGSDMAYEAAFRQTGIIRADRVEDLFTMAKGFASLPLPGGPSLAIVANAGGPGVVAADACGRAGLSLAQLAPDTVTALKEQLQPYAARYNPVLVADTADAGRIVTAAATLLGDPGVHSLFLVLILPASAAGDFLDGVGAAIAALPNPGKKPVVACLMGGAAVMRARRNFVAAGMPCYPFPEQAADSLAAMYRQSRWKENPLPVEVGYRHNRDRAAAIIEAARSERCFELGEYQSQEILRAYEFPCLEARLARTSDEAAHIAKQLGGSVALKIASPQILHKTDVRGVVLNLDTPHKVRAAFGEITARAKRLRKNAYIAGCLVQAMAPEHSREVIIGFKRDNRFGPMVFFGLGTIHAEAFNDLSCRLAPLSLDDAHDMVREIRAFPLLAGRRGERAVKFTVLEDLLLIMSQLALGFPEIQEVECDPVFVNEAGARVGDIRILLSHAHRPQQQ